VCVCVCVCVCVYLSFDGHFPGGPGLARTRMSPFLILVELRMMQVVVTTGAIRRAKSQSKCHHQQTNTQFVCVYRMQTVCVKIDGAAACLVN